VDTFDKLDFRDIHKRIIYRWVSGSGLKNKLDPGGLELLHVEHATAAGDGSNASGSAASAGVGVIESTRVLAATAVTPATPS